VSPPRDSIFFDKSRTPPVLSTIFPRRDFSACQHVPEELEYFWINFVVFTDCARLAALERSTADNILGTADPPRVCPSAFTLDNAHGLCVPFFLPSVRWMVFFFTFSSEPHALRQHHRSSYIYRDTSASPPFYPFFVPAGEAGVLPRHVPSSMDSWPSSRNFFFSSCRCTILVAWLSRGDDDTTQHQAFLNIVSLQIFLFIPSLAPSPLFQVEPLLQVLPFGSLSA